MVWKLREEYPGIRSALVLLYLDRKLSTENYDSTTYPLLETVPQRYAVLHKNEWMVQAAEVKRPLSAMSGRCGKNFRVCTEKERSVLIKMTAELGISLPPCEITQKDLSFISNTSMKKENDHANL